MYIYVMCNITYVMLNIKKLNPLNICNGYI